jgi:peroxiredoxin
MQIRTFVAALLVFSIGCSESSKTTVSVQEAPERFSQATTDPTEGEAANARSLSLTKLIEDHEAAKSARIAEVRLAADDAEKFEIAHEAYATQDFPQKLFDFAIAADDEASLDACRYIINEFTISKLRYSAIDHVVEQHLNKMGMDSFFLALVHHYAHDTAADACLKAGMAASSNKTRAHATYQLALLHLQRRDWCLDSADSRQHYIDSLGMDVVSHLLSENGTDEIANLLEKVITEYRGEQYFDYSIAERAEQSLFTLKNLEVGCNAPAVVGKDSAGRELKLRDQQGKVVVVCFWAHWCGICMESLPRETAFVTSMKNRPFIWLGVNGDDDIELLKKAESSAKVNFQSWHDGREGAIATQWNIWGFPTLFVIDHEGIIRYKSRGHVDLDQIFPFVEELVSVIESDRKPGITKP